MARGWQGAPILYANDMLITGTHRQEALRRLRDIGIEVEGEIALDVSEIVDNWIDETGNDIEFDNLGVIFEGTEIEKYKDEINEW